MKTSHAQASRLLIVGAGDVAWRALPWLRQRFRVFALCRSEQAAARWRAGGAIPVIGDLDDRATLTRLRGLACRVLHSAPPDAGNVGDPRTLRLLARLGSARIIPRALVYIGTTGVYGDCGGARIDETRTRRAANPRAARRVAAEDALRAWLRSDVSRRRARTTALALLRVPGIYARERLPLARLRAGTSALRAAEDGYTSHIHADDLARAAGLALFRVRGGRAINVCDDSEVRMGDWFDQVALAFGLTRPARISRAEAERTLPESLLSFMRESRRLDNRRMKQELGLRLRYATVGEGLAAAVEHERIFPVAGGSGRGRGE